MSLESWKLILETVGVVAVGVSVVAGALALVVGNRINKIQAAQVRQFDDELTAAKIELGKQQVRAANAEHDASDAKKSAGDADTKAEGFRLDIAKANERAAEATRVAEQEHLARVRIEEKLAGWKLDAAAQARIIDKLKKYEKTPFDLGANPDAVSFMEVTDGILSSAGWSRKMPDPDNPLGMILLNGKARINYVSGIYVEIATSRVGDFGPAAKALVEALIAEGIPAQGQISAGETNTSAIHIVVGNK